MSAMTLHHVEDTTLLFQRFAEHLSDHGIVALADLDREDGSFHPADIEFTTAHVINGDEKDFPVFLVTARKA